LLEFSINANAEDRHDTTWIHRNGRPQNYIQHL